MGSANANRALRISGESQRDIASIHKHLVTAKEHAELFRELAEEQRPAAVADFVAALFAEIAEAYEELAKKKGR